MTTQFDALLISLIYIFVWANKHTETFTNNLLFGYKNINGRIFKKKINCVGFVFVFASNIYN